MVGCNNAPPQPERRHFGVGYSFTLQLRPAVLAGLVNELAIRFFEYETRKRFLALDQYLTHQAGKFRSEVLTFNSRS